MSFPRYPDYRDSGVEWLGEVPGHWQLAKLKHLARFAGGGTPSRDNPNFWGGSIPWVSPKDMKVARIETAEECITEEGLAGSSTGLIPPGRVLMVVRSGILKHTIPVAINAAEVALNQDMKALDFSAGACSAEFFFRWVQGLNDFLLLEWAKQGATVESIEHAYLAETLLPLPPAPEQAAIAAFLDRETAKIDALPESAEYEQAMAHILRLLDSPPAQDTWRDEFADGWNDMVWTLKQIALAWLQVLLIIVFNVIWWAFLIIVALPIVWDWFWQLPSGLK